MAPRKSVEQVKADIEAAAPAATKEPTRDQLVTEAQQRGIKGASGMNKTQLVAAIAKAMDETGTGSKRTARKAADAPKPEGPQPDENPGRRLAKATKEQRALKAWEAAGKKGARPSTVNYDAVIAEHAANGGKAESGRTRKRRERTGTGAPRGQHSERGRIAIERRAQGGKRDVTRKLNEAELVEYIANIKATIPDAQLGDERPYAYWIECLSFNRQRFNELWETVAPAKTPGSPTPRKRPASTKAPAQDKPATEAPVKSAAPRKPRAARKAA